MQRERNCTSTTRRRLATLATCNLNQWSLDFGGNLLRIIQSIELAKAAGARYRGGWQMKYQQVCNLDRSASTTHRYTQTATRVQSISDISARNSCTPDDFGPELEVPAYGCEDHFQELDTAEHSWECIAELLRGKHTHDILCDVGMPIIHRGVRYNSRIFLLDGKVIHIRPKTALADDGNYRETRYFKTWKSTRQVEQYCLPPEIREITGQRTCSFGNAALQLNDAVLAAETCEELFTPLAPHIALALSGVEIITNGSGSHHQLRKLHQRLDLIRSGTAKAGGIYLYANQQGCDGNRLYYDGCACVAVNGQLVAQGSQFAIGDVEVVTATVDLDEVVSYRGAVSSLQEQASSASPVPTVYLDFNLCHPAEKAAVPSAPIEPRYHVPEEEIALGPACWLWDYLRRSGANGFLLPLSGGADSSAVAAIVGSMCQLVVKAIDAGNKQAEDDARRVGQYSSSEQVKSSQQLANRLLTTVYMGTVNSSRETKDRAASLARQIGADHLDVKIDPVVNAMASLLSGIIGHTPRFRADGGTNAENLALQNIQARLRMVLAFFVAQLRLWSRGLSGFQLVLGTANVDECLRGYLTKYDCSSADLNPIGAISKNDLKRFLVWASEHLGYSELRRVEAAPPTAELEPIREGIAAQLDEVDMGMTYEELGIYGRLRKISRCGPVSMFRRLLVEWHDRYPPAQIAERVKSFFRFYSMNRHKATVLTPAYHAEQYNPSDHRFDHRPFLYNNRWPWQFASIDAIVRSFASSSDDDK